MRDPPPLASGAVTEVRPDQASALVEAMADEGELAGLRFARGCRCFAAWEDGRVAAYGWLSTGPEWIGELAVEISPLPGEAYVWNCFTLPEHRLRGRFRDLLAGIVAQASAEGLRRLWIGSLGGATPAVVAAGFRPALEIRLDRDGDLRRLHLSPAPGADPGLAGAARAVLGPAEPAPYTRRRH